MNPQANFGLKQPEVKHITLTFTIPENVCYSEAAMLDHLRLVDLLPDQLEGLNFFDENVRKQFSRWNKYVQKSVKGKADAWKNTLIELLEKQLLFASQHAGTLKADWDNYLLWEKHDQRRAELMHSRYKSAHALVQSLRRMIDQLSAVEL
jgi:hypothetical protein